MKLYDESELQASIEAGEVKLASARQRKRRARRRFVVGSLALLVLIPFGVWLGVVAGQAPPTPLLVVTWPKPKVNQVLTSGQALLGRRGQPFSVAVSDPENWSVTWRSRAAESRASSYRWDPVDAQDQLLAQCQPRARGVVGLFSFLWPTRQASLRCVEAPKVPRYENGALNEYTHVLATGPEGAWIYPNIFAVGQVSWDERALPLLAAAVPAESGLGSALAQGSKVPSARTWQIVSDFDGHSQKASTDGTFAMLESAELENLMPLVATQIIRKEPTLSLKFIVRLDKDPADGIVRLAFDGKSQRKAWIRRPGQRAGSPLTGWENGVLGRMPMGLPPAPPR